VDPVPDALLLRKSGSAGNRTRDLSLNNPYIIINMAWTRVLEENWLNTLWYLPRLPQKASVLFSVEMFELQISSVILLSPFFVPEWLCRCFALWTGFAITLCFYSFLLNWWFSLWDCIPFAIILSHKVSRPLSNCSPRPRYVRTSVTAFTYRHCTTSISVQGCTLRSDNIPGTAFRDTSCTTLIRSANSQKDSLKATDSIQKGNELNYN
jgi:hypothetical protein